MACHLAGVPTAVATCGTAFGEDHARVLRRVLLDQDAFHGEVIFTFDGDEAGRRAAVKAFSGDQQFVAQTYVAVEPRGMDPCDLRLADGDAAVRELIASRIPLYRFVLDNTLERYDLDRADQRVDAVREAVTLTRAIRDKSKVEEFLREVAAKVGLDIEQVRAEFRRAKEPASARPNQAVPTAGDGGTVSNFGAPEFADEREVLKALVQFPQVAAGNADDLTDSDFTHPVAQELWLAIAKLGLPRAADASWVARVESELVSEDARRILSVAAVQPLPAGEEVDGARCRRHHPPTAGTDAVAPHRRREVEAPAHEPGRTAGRLQQHVRRADGAGAAAPFAPRPRERPLIVHTVRSFHGLHSFGSFRGVTAAVDGRCTRGPLKLRGSSRRRRCRASESWNSHVGASRERRRARRTHAAEPAARRDARASPGHSGQQDRRRAPSGHGRPDGRGRPIRSRSRCAPFDVRVAVDHRVDPLVEAAPPGPGRA